MSKIEPRDTEIKNKLTVTRGEVRGDNREIRGNDKPKNTYE